MADACPWPRSRKRLHSTQDSKTRWEFSSLSTMARLDSLAGAISISQSVLASWVLEEEAAFIKWTLFLSDIWQVLWVRAEPAPASLLGWPFALAWWATVNLWCWRKGWCVFTLPWLYLIESSGDCYLDVWKISFKNFLLYWSCTFIIEDASGGIGFLKKQFQQHREYCWGSWGFQSDGLVLILSSCAYFSWLQAIERRGVWSRTKRLQSALRQTRLFIPRGDMSASHRLWDSSDKSHLHFFAKRL